MIPISFFHHYCVSLSLLCHLQDIISYLQKNKEGLYHARLGVVVSWLLVNAYHNQTINQSCAGANYHSDVNEVMHGKLVSPCIFSSTVTLAPAM